MDFIDLIIRFLFGPEDVICAIWPAIIAGAIGLLGTGASVAGSASARSKNERQLKALETENEAEYLREYYRGALDNDGAKSYLKRLDERMKRADKATENALTSQGATHENALAAKQANNQVYSDAVANLVEGEQDRKDQIKSGYKQTKGGLAQGQMGMNAQQAQTWGQIGQGIASAAGSVASAYYAK